MLFFQINRKAVFKGSEYLMIDNLRVANVAVTGNLPEAKVKNAGSRIVSDSFYSKILGKKKKFTVVVPDGYKKSTVKYPVLYLFHGRGRHERSLVDNSKSRAALMKAKFITVLPDGDDNWYINSPVDKKSRYNDYIEELMRFVEKKYPVSKDREKRGLSGWSMGGYGCTMFAETHPEQFSALAPIIALLDYPRHGLPKGQSYGIQTKRFGKDPVVWKKFNPITNVDKLKNMKLFIITGKKCFTLTMNRNFTARLKKLNIPVEYIEINGGHSFAVVTAALSRVISFMNQTIVNNQQP
jgi:enterochelin esterase-like enzyme